MNKKLIFLLILPIIILLSISIYWGIAAMIGKEVKVAIRGYDPRDLLSGHYISYTIDWNKTDCWQFADNFCPQDEFCQGGACKFYIPETDAEKLNDLLQYSDNDFSLIYKYKVGQMPMAKELLIDGKPWKEYIQETKKRNP